MHVCNKLCTCNCGMHVCLYKMYFFSSCVAQELNKPTQKLMKSINFGQSTRCNSIIAITTQINMQDTLLLAGASWQISNPGIMQPY